VSGWKDMPADQPRVCAICGKRIVLATVEALMFRTHPAPQSFHFRCKRP
jgi:hypothetical protein